MIYANYCKYDKILCIELSHNVAVERRTWQTLYCSHKSERRNNDALPILLDTTFTHFDQFALKKLTEGQFQGVLTEKRGRHDA